MATLTPLDAVQQAIDSVDKLQKSLTKSSSKQVTASSERLTVKAVASVWFKTLRLGLVSPATGALMVPLDNKYNELLTYSDRSTRRSTYKSHLKALKTELMRFREQLTILTTTGQINTQVRPSFALLVADNRLLSIVERRWDEAANCIESAPLTAVVMIGALLEALLLSRIEREPDKAPLFKLKSAPKDGSGKSKNMKEWTLNDYINVCFEMKWIGKPLKDIGQVLRDYRNLIHPREELKQAAGFSPSEAKMIWSVFGTMAEQIVASVSSSP